MRELGKATMNCRCIAICDPDTNRSASLRLHLIRGRDEVHTYLSSAGLLRDMHRIDECLIFAGDFDFAKTSRLCANLSTYHIKPIFYDEDGDLQKVVDCMAGGAGYFLRLPVTEEILSQTFAIIRQRLAVQRQIDQFNPLGLSPREMDFIVGVKRGKSNRRIAEELGISESTIGTHRRKIRNKLMGAKPK